MHRLLPISLLPLLAACSAPPEPASAPGAGQVPVAEGALAEIAADPQTIAQVQGDGARSPLIGRRVRVEGIVVGEFVAGLGGVFIQSTAADADDSAGTAEGLWLPRGGEQRPKLVLGDHVRATGVVAELVDGKPGEDGDGPTLTSLVDAQVEVLGRGDVAATLVEAPPADWEALEGMRVHIDTTLDVVGVDSLARYGELVVAFDGPVWAPTERAAPNAAGTIAAANARRMLRLDDASGRRDPDRIAWLPQPPGDTAPLRVGSRVSGVDGVLDQRFGNWRLQLTAAPAAIAQAARPPAPTVAGDLRIAGLNVLNLFNGDGRGGGFPTDRGAETSAQYARQQAKLVAVVQALDPDIVALMELENDGYGPESALAQFVAALNAAGPHADWQFVAAGSGPAFVDGKGPGGNAIRVGLIYRGERVRAVGAPASIAVGPFAEHSRAPLLQAFRSGNGPVFVVAANHFKSKGCGENASGGDVDKGDHQGCWNDTRVKSARHLTEWLGTDPTGTRPTGTLLIGDFNAYGEEDPLRQLRSFGWRDAFAASGGEGRQTPYSFVFAGQRGRLDHALVDAGLAGRLRGAEHWHVNADESDLFDYRREAAGGTTPWRASDHDPLLLGFDLTN